MPRFKTVDDVVDEYVKFLSRCSLRHGELSESQKKMVKKLIDRGDIQRATKVIIEALDKEDKRCQSD